MEYIYRSKYIPSSECNDNGEINYRNISHNYLSVLIN